MTPTTKDHDPQCEALDGRVCTCGTEELWSGAADQLKRLAQQLTQPASNSMPQVQVRDLKLRSA